MAISGKITKNAIWLIGGNIVHALISFVVSLLTARYLGPGNYGLIGYATAYTNFFFSLCTLGLSSVVVKGIVDQPEKEGEILGSALLMRGVSSILSAMMIVGIVGVVDADEPVTIAVVALCSLGLVFRVFDTFNCWFQAKLKSKYTALASTAAYIVSSGYKVFLLATGKGVQWFALATSVDYIVAAIVLFSAYRRMKGSELAFSLKTCKAMLQRSYPYILSGMMVAVYGSTDKLMLKQMLGEEAVGYYSIAVSICTIWTFVLSAIIQSFNPVIMKWHSDDRRMYEKYNRILYAFVFYASIFVSIAYILFGDFAISLFYGKEYAPAAVPMKIITWYVAFSYLGIARDAWMVCENKQRYLTGLYMGAAAINVVLNALFIPRWGNAGAAVASLITQISTIALFPVLIRDLRPNVKLMLQGIAFWDFRKNKHRF